MQGVELWGPPEYPLVPRGKPFHPRCAAAFCHALSIYDLEATDDSRPVTAPDDPYRDQYVVNRRANYLRILERAGLEPDKTFLSAMNDDED